MDFNQSVKKQVTTTGQKPTENFRDDHAKHSCLPIERQTSFGNRYGLLPPEPQNREASYPALTTEYRLKHCNVSMPVQYTARIHASLLTSFYTKTLKAIGTLHSPPKQQVALHLFWTAGIDGSL